MSSKQVIVIRTDLNMRKGKMCSQAAHASMAAVFRDGKFYHDDDESFMIIKIPTGTLSWFDHTETFKKIVVGIESEIGLHELFVKAKAAGLPTVEIVDRGLTEFHGNPTLTAIAIGPGDPALIDSITGHLKLL